MFLAQGKEIEQIEEKEETFHRFLNANTSKLNCKLSYITKKAFIKHKANFQYCIPWHYFTGDFAEIIEISKLLKIEANITNTTIENTKSYTIQSPPIQKNTVSNRSTLVKRPFPSAKAAESLRTINPPVRRQSEVAPSTKRIKRDDYLVSNLDDMTIPVPKTMNVVFDSEYLKVRISKMFKDFEFKETVIFEDNFDQVLRKGSFYIFIKFYKDILSQAEAYKVIEHLGSIAGLRNQFLCIVVADTIEENSMKILNEFNVLHLTLNDVLLEDALKSKIYNTILV